VKIEGTFEVKNSASTIEAKKVIRDEEQITEATQLFPHKIAGNTIDLQIAMGGVSLAKRVYIKVDYEVTLKIQQSTDTGFPFGPGDGFFTSDSGITGIWVTTGPNETELEAVITGD
jgi:hypothetical protein